MADSKIDLDGLPVAAPGEYDYLVGTQLGNARKWPLPEVNNAAALLAQSIFQIIADAEAEMEAVVASLGYEPSVPYSAGLLMQRTTQTVEVAGYLYSPLATAIPFTTTNWSADAAKFKLVQAVTSTQLGTLAGAQMVGFKQIGAGSFLRPLEGKLQESISALDYIDPVHHAAIRNGTSTHNCAPGINNAIQAAISLGIGKVYLPGGKYPISDTIILGQASGFTFVELSGDGPCYRGTVKGGTALIASFSDRPAVNFQGARASMLRGLSVIGPLADWVMDNDLAGEAPLLDDTEGAAWIDPALHANQDSRYAPCAGVTVDAYAGSAPAASYPGAYGKGASSSCAVEECVISGFTAGFVNQPCDYDGNGDFTALRRVQIERCKYAISIGNSQSRNFSMDNVDIGRCFIGITNNTHGKQVGKMNGTISCLSVGRIIHLLSLNNSAYFGPLRFLHLYAESMWRLGWVNMASSNESALTFDSCTFSLGYQDGVRGVPHYFQEGAITQGFLSFENCGFRLFPGVLSFGGTPDCLAFRGCGMENEGFAGQEYERLALNALSGGLVVSGSVTGSRACEILWDSRPISAGGGGVRRKMCDGVMMSSREAPIPLLAHLACPSLSLGDRIPLPRRWYAQNKATLASCSVSGRTLTFSFTSRTDARFLMQGPDCGDVIYDGHSGTTFFVRSRTGATVIAEAQNNYKPVGGGAFALRVAFSTTEGSFWFGNSRVFSPSYPLLGDVTLGSPVIANCGRGDGVSTFIDAEISVGDGIFLNRDRDAYASESDCVVAARDQATKTITLSGNADETRVRQRIQFLVRKPPANV